MPRYLVTEVRAYEEQWLIDAEDEEQAQLRNGKIVEDGDYGWHNSWAEDIYSREVESDREYI